MPNQRTIPLPTSPSAHTITYHPSAATTATSQQQQQAAPPPQPKVSPIATLPSKPNAHPTGSLLDLNESYIVYGVKNGLIRVINS
eukprot:CAMPEP_0198275192 /NCGR_PEP_ID=MMETSP1447-20131203/63496_1 /TAXON_ID=420782 /ORGANISM="Chaetoceros dichaeta, Strain CCMP1751" /LENGTH=84 /DNA_ID=CAMNT_0043969837 /DNA_START=76 /DNA_END=327 /DNA_ORIENTATION=+